ncbi:MAG: Ig-like domain-containing protein [Planctomycetes bacterium]|nr:Ig-like domain-containing protein [Planctomycetota bacterium]
MPFLRFPVRPRTVLLALALVGAALALPACDNPACVFGGVCSPGGTGGALGTLAAQPPENGQILRPAEPRVQRFAPSGADADPQTPIVIVFSEAMSDATLASAFQLDQIGFGSIPLQATALVGDGRVLVLFPITALAPGSDYRVRFRDNATLGDRTGQAVVRSADGVVGSFTVAQAAPPLPRLLASYPDRNETGLPATTEIVTVFSRPMNPTTVNSTTFEVTVAGQPPPFPADPVPVTISGLATDTRVFRWRSRDDDGAPADLVLDGEVRVSLSPLPAPIEDQGGADLSPEIFTFRTLPFSAPLAASITSFPNDAIGISNVTGPADLAVEVEFTDAVVGDEIGVFVFGVQPESVEAPRTIALFRSAIVAAPPLSFTFTAAELNLLSSESPIRGRVRDGPIQMAFRVKRGALESPVRVLDVDPLALGAQGPLLDTVAPVLLGVGNSGTSNGLVLSDARDVVVVGRASEVLRAAYVTTPLGDNEVRPGEPPPVVGSDAASGLFVAAPVRAGVLQDFEEPLSYTLTIYDRALNAGGASVGTFVQRAAAASGFPRPFAQVEVEVYDESTLLAVAGAEVLSHEDVDGSIFEAGSAITDADGRAVVDPALIGRTLVTVRRAGYDLFTFDGVTTDSVSIPLRPTAAAPGSIGGQVTSTDPAVGTYTRRVGDTRFARPGETLAAVASCAFDGTDQRFECTFGPAQVLARELGALTGFATQPPSSALLWTAPTFLRGFGLQLPLAEVAPGGTQTLILTLERLDAVGLDEELLPIDVDPRVLSTASWPTLSGEPRIRVEGLAPGLRGPLTVGQGLAFSAGLPPATFAVRAAYPGAADPFQDLPRDALGRLVRDGVLEPDLFLRAEVVSPAGARGIDRPRLSAGGAALVPPPAPVIAGAALVLNATGLSYDVAFTDVLTDASGQPGIHRLTLTDSAGRRWTVWRPDEPDAAGGTVVVHLPLASDLEEFPLSAGDLTGLASSFSWTLFDPTSFLWTDVDREFERAAHSSPATLAGP